MLGDDWRGCLWRQGLETIVVKSMVDYPYLLRIDAVVADKIVVGLSRNGDDPPRGADIPLRGALEHQPLAAWVALRFDDVSKVMDGDHRRGRMDYRDNMRRHKERVRFVLVHGA